MKVLHSKKVLLGLKCVNMDFYESCVYGKQKRVIFVKTGKEKKEGEIRACAYRCMGTGLGIFPWRLSLLCYIY